MKLSLAKILKNLQSVLLLNTLLVVIVALFVYEQNFSYKKIENLDEQKSILKALRTISKSDDPEVAKIQFDGKTSLLLVKINQLQRLYKYDLLGKYFIYSPTEYMQDFNELGNLIKELDRLAKRYFEDKKDSTGKKLEELLLKTDKKIDELYIKIVHNNKHKNFILAQLVTILLLLSIFTTFWYRKRLKTIFEDIFLLSSIHHANKNHEANTQEADAILHRLRKKNADTVDQSLLDPVTDTLNYKGLRTVYAQKKNMKETYFTSVTVLEIDNFSKTDREYPLELTQTILKKVAFTLSLFEQTTDIVARTDYNQFTIVIARATKEQCFKEVERIKESINELKFKLPNGKYANISISVGFAIKQSNKPLDDVIAFAKQLLKVAKEKGGNMIAQKSDLTKLDI